ncbi:hypothetical protein CTA2_3421 [Colletotrichum tanaceti]|uniref:Uncharacterized protein n=1 Tax=Colletotrichum tanaceti TaxID=1306861 RepID=A0A4V6DGT2_9PEZI|nr:hypothetical protein CTA2_3421 [Colletotrichum tanaceti]TKW53916.1 hypothetical protein CTA1_96 [Colletotrichum tanaceti]
MVSLKSIIVAALVSGVMAAPLKTDTTALHGGTVDKVPEIEARGKGDTFDFVSPLPQAGRGATRIRTSAADDVCSSAERDRLDKEIRDRYAMKDRLDIEIRRRERVKDDLEEQIRTTRQRRPN